MPSHFVLEHKWTSDACCLTILECLGRHAM
jgi:hypothetical protein